MRATLLMLVLAGFSGMCVSLAAPQIGGPSLKLSCNALYLSQGRTSELLGRPWDMGVGLKIEPCAGWKLAWCEDEKAVVTMEDSTGSKAAGVSCRYSSWDANEEGALRLYPLKWKPSIGSRRVWVKGKVPFVVSRKDAVSEPVTVKLVRDFSVPVELKGAGLDGDGDKRVDVQATLKVKSGEKGKKQVEFELSADRKLGFRGFELQTAKGEAMIAKCWFSGDGGTPGCHSWRSVLQMDEAPEDEVRVVVWYAGEPQRVLAAVDSFTSLSGFGYGEGGAVDGEAQPGVGRKAEPGVPGEIPDAVVVQSVSGKESAVKAKLDGFDIKGDIMWRNVVREEFSPRLVFRVRFETKGTADFGFRPDLGEQTLKATDSTGRVLNSAVFSLSRMRPQKDKGVSYTVVEGKGPELASPGAEWVRINGVLCVPMDELKECPVYELPLVKGAELHIPVPGMEESVVYVGDVATVKDAPTCKLWMKTVDRRAGGDLGVEISLQVEGVPFDFSGFELVDDKGNPLDVVCYSLVDSGGGDRKEWRRSFIVRKAESMNRLRVKLKYKVETEIVPVPVDIKVGLGGPVPEKKAENEGR